MKRIIKYESLTGPSVKLRIRKGRYLVRDGYGLGIEGAGRCNRITIQHYFRRETDCKFAFSYDFTPDSRDRDFIVLCLKNGDFDRLESAYEEVKR